MELFETQAFTKKCFHDEPATCSCACPFGLDLRSFIKKAGKGRAPGAYRELADSIPFPSVAAYLCPHPCTMRCSLPEPIDIPGIEKWCVDGTKNDAPTAFTIPAKEQSVAIIGAGVSGLAAALALARKKFKISVFDEKALPGGRITDHENYSVFKADFDKQFSIEKAEFNYERQISSLDELSSFDAIIIASGKGGETFGLLPSYNSFDFSTERKGVFLCGEVTGLPLMEAMASSRRLSRIIEAYVQTGRTELPSEDKSVIRCEGHLMPPPEGMELPAAVKPEGEFFSKTEVKEEAARCLGCVCNECFTACEMLEKYKKTPAKLAADICTDSNTCPPFTNCEATRQTYSCNQCGLCKEVCPSDVSMGDLFAFSREDRHRQNKWVPGLHDFWLRELEFMGSEGFFAAPGKSGKNEYVFFPGCKLSQTMPETTKKAWSYLDDKLSCGIILGCCGIPAQWAGDKPDLDKNTALLSSTLEGMGNPKIVCACLSCVKQLKSIFPEREIITIYELLSETGISEASFPIRKAAIFDPCSSRYEENARSSVRKLAGDMSLEASELGGKIKCCGNGGHMYLANPGLYDKITEARVSASEEPYLVYCANCYEVFKAAGKECFHILPAIFSPEENAPLLPGLDTKRKNHLELKAMLSNELKGESFSPCAAPWDNISLAIDDAVALEMEKKLISGADLRELIYKAENDKDYFVNAEGVHIACLVREVITTWCGYVPGETYEIKSVYSHRMHFLEEGN